MRPWREGPRPILSHNSAFFLISFLRSRAEFESFLSHNFHRSFDMKTNLPAAAVCLAAMLSCPCTAEAQFTGSLGGNFNNPGSALLQTMIANRMLADAARKRTASPHADGSGTPSKPKPTPSKTTPAPRLTFKPVAKNLMVGELAASMAKEADARGQFATLFEEYLKAFDEQTRKDREPSYDISRAAAFFVLANYAAATGAELTDEQAEGTQAKFRAGLTDNAAFAKMSDRDRQRLYEALVILGSLPGTGLADAAEKKDTKEAEMFRDLARMNLQTLLGVPVTKIHLTRDGFTMDE